MRIKYILNTTDTSFDYGDFPGSTCICYQENGFYLEIYNGVINIDSFEPFGVYLGQEEYIKTLSDLKRFITDNFNLIDKEYIELFKRLLEIIKRNEKDGRTDLLPV